MRHNTPNGITRIVKWFSHVTLSILIHNIAEWVVEQNIFVHGVSIKQVQKIANSVIDELYVLLRSGFVAEICYYRWWDFDLCFQENFFH